LEIGSLRQLLTEHWFFQFPGPSWDLQTEGTSKKDRLSVCFAAAM